MNTYRVYVEFNGAPQTGYRFLDSYDGDITADQLSDLLHAGLCRTKVRGLPLTTEVTLGRYEMSQDGDYQRTAAA